MANRTEETTETFEISQDNPTATFTDDGKLLRETQQVRAAENDTRNFYFEHEFPIHVEFRQRHVEFFRANFPETSRQERRELKLRLRGKRRVQKQSGQITGVVRRTDRRPHKPQAARLKRRSIHRKIVHRHSTAEQRRSALQRGPVQVVQQPAPEFEQTESRPEAERFPRPPQAGTFPLETWRRERIRVGAVGNSVERSSASD